MNYQKAIADTRTTEAQMAEQQRQYNTSIALQREQINAQNNYNSNPVNTAYYSGNFNRAIEYSLKNMVSPDSFVDIRVYRSDDLAKELNIDFNYETCELMLPEPMKHEEAIDIAIESIQTLIELKEYLDLNNGLNKNDESEEAQ